MRELNLDRLRTLVTIADLGSFAEAARVLHLAPPTVSLHIAVDKNKGRGGHGMGLRVIAVAPTAA